MPRSAPRACTFPGCRHYQPCPDHARSTTIRVQHPYEAVLHTPAWRALSRTVIAEEPVCHWCHVNPSTVADHVVPLADGGPALDRGNVVGSCNGCNVSRGQRAAQARRAREKAAT